MLRSVTLRFVQMRSVTLHYVKSGGVKSRYVKSNQVYVKSSTVTSSYVKLRRVKPSQVLKEASSPSSSCTCGSDFFTDAWRENDENEWQKLQTPPGEQSERENPLKRTFSPRAIRDQVWLKFLRHLVFSLTCRFFSRARWWKKNKRVHVNHFIVHFSVIRVLNTLIQSCVFSFGASCSKPKTRETIITWRQSTCRTIQNHSTFVKSFQKLVKIAHNLFQNQSILSSTFSNKLRKFFKPFSNPYQTFRISFQHSLNFFQNLFKSFPQSLHHHSFYFEPVSETVRNPLWMCCLNDCYVGRRVCFQMSNSRNMCAPPCIELVPLSRLHLRRFHDTVRRNFFFNPRRNMKGMQSVDRCMRFLKASQEWRYRQRPKNPSVILSGALMHWCVGLRVQMFFFLRKSE